MASQVFIIRRKLREFTGPAVLVALVIWMLHRSLFSGGRLIPSWPETDLMTEFQGWRYFGFTQWMQGHFPFWNPHVFCGIPFAAQIQSNLFYPIAWINFLCRPPFSLIVEMVVDISLGAIFTYAWARQRGISRCGATLAGTAFAFSGPVYLRVMAGHMTPLATLAWMPLLFLSFDRILAERFASGMLLGTLAVCLQWLGGHPQLLYYTALIGGAYVLLHGAGHKRILAVLAACAGIYILGTMLAAAQVLPAVLASRLTLRGLGMPYQDASAFSVAPENLLSLIIPYPIGDGIHRPYAGRWYIWEMSLYFGIINLTLAIIALTRMSARRRWRMVALLSALLILMLGAYTPVYVWLYAYFPAYGMFRGMSKFAIILILFLSILAGEGFDLVRKKSKRSWAIGAFLAAIVFCILGVFFLECDSITGPAGRMILTVLGSHEYYNPGIFVEPNLVEKLSQWIAWQWFIAAALMAVAGRLLYWPRFSSRTPYVLLFLAMTEIYAAACCSSVLAPAKIVGRPEWARAVAEAKKANQRVVYSNDVLYGNIGNQTGEDTLWGYDPALPARYAQMIAISQNEHITTGTQGFPRYPIASRVLEMLRCRYILQWDQDPAVRELPHPMPQLQLLGQYVRMNDVDTIDDWLNRDFDFRHSAILETDPSPLPSVAGAAGSARVVRKTINDVEIQADLPAPALLLITDAYAPGWKARSIDTNPDQREYQVLRADNVLRVIPLGAGHHHFDLYYVAPGFWAGVAISLIGLVIFGAFLGWMLLRRKPMPFS